MHFPYLRLAMLPAAASDMKGRPKTDSGRGVRGPFKAAGRDTLITLSGAFPQGSQGYATARAIKTRSLGLVTTCEGFALSRAAHPLDCG
ncbi:hypothetical protein SAMN00790413_06091 [Deinococcus hopiensis KR-140]|uniref:Uncharacterized protein n=1 Tax=Deinococcus hopiensis KR-140 TaxID=695939 RepID=A0A1W1VW76_9DEIO|nr:hypothetical protein SAMN00790413_06091 [Deinococcus hopiensis KR-140]